MRFKQYLTEKTYAIGADVDLIYNKFFKKPIIMVQKGDFNGFRKLLKGGGIFGSIKSSELKSKQAEKADKINPIIINAGVVNGGSNYTPSTSTINISLNANATNLLQQSTFDKIKNAIGDDDVFERFSNEFTEGNIKGSIYHELSHWLNDTLHNRNIDKRLKKAKEMNSLDPLRKDGSTLFTDYEIDAQVHALKQLKRSYRKVWDDFTWIDIIQKKSSFEVVFTKLKGSPINVQTTYFKTLLKRLNREKLLGNNMKNTFFDAIRGK